MFLLPTDHLAYWGVPSMNLPGSTILGILLGFEATKPVRLHNFGDLGAKFRFEASGLREANPSGADEWHCQRIARPGSRVSTSQK